MAYVDNELTSKIRTNLKKKFPLKDGYKFSVAKGAGSYSVRVRVVRLPFTPTINGEPIEESSVNHYHYKNHGYDDRTTKFIEEVLAIITEDHWDESDIQIDYFNCAYYYDLAFGRWDKPLEIV